MNSNQNKSSPLSLNNYNFDFDLGIGSNRPKSLNDQKTPNSSAPSYSSYSYSSTATSSSQPRPSWQPNKPSWSHKPVSAPATQTGLPGGPPSMVGDIFGKSWGSTQPSASASASASTVGIANKNPNLFGDLVTSALGQGPRSSSNVPLKNATPASKPSAPATSTFSMGKMEDSLPKTANTAQSSTNWGSSANLGGSSTGNGGTSMNSNRSPNLGGPSLSTMGVGGSAGSGFSSSNNDPFSSLSGIGSKQSGAASLNSAAKSQKNDLGDDGFGDFQNAYKPTSAASVNVGIDIDFGGSATSNQTPVQGSAAGADPMDMFFSSSSASAGGTAAATSQGFGGQASAEVEDWGLDSEFGGGGHDVGGTTTELEGLPPPPAGVSGAAAKNKGMDNYKQGQFADAIKWLSWAVILLEKAGDNAGSVEVLSCRASCYKEVGEYKKAVADCTKVLENDEKNVSVLVQRALLYESMEKYRLGAEDLRTVLKIDPGNRVARSTVHRLAKMAD
ncbi:uncharacterized protein LOC130969899 [Arachis stenosperma]|uniref:uncharacterized protein LOC130969899 n=1 Tax=Arachis stenosperma TaxID=217475 RepID=UPI0025AB9B45|nr:uncharacterized protein LOC130969899 [Arachis stenosperma]